MSTTTSKSLNMNSVNHGRLSQRFDLIRKLGQGTYGKVQLGINKITGVEVALKTIKKCKIESRADLVRIKREITIMSCCNHPNIIHIYEVYENKEKIILVMEYAQGGELYDYLNDKKKLEEDEAKRIFSQISSAIYYCHKHMIVHRDLKLENILLDENNNAKIADFGLSNVYGDQLLKTFCGSPLYASPEIVRGIPYQGPEVDCWSLGVLLYTLVYGSMPFDGTHFKKLVKQITSGSYYEPNIKSGAGELIRCLLTVDSKRRLSIHQVVAHTWLLSTECQSISEEFCNLAPVKGEFLVGINKSDTLDEVSDISSTSLDDEKPKAKPKPVRKSPKADSSEPPKGQVPVIDTPKIAKPPRADKLKTEPHQVAETILNQSERKEKSTDTTKIEPKPKEYSKPPYTKPKDTIDIAAKPDDAHSKPKDSARTPESKPKVAKIMVKVPGSEPKDRSKTPELQVDKIENDVLKPGNKPKGRSKTPETKTKDPAKTESESKPVAKPLDVEAAPPATVAQKAKSPKLEAPIDTKISTEAKSHLKQKMDEPTKHTQTSAVTKPKTETKQETPVAESSAKPLPPETDAPQKPAEPTVILRNQRSTSTSTSEEPSSPTPPVPTNAKPTERRSSKTISPKTAPLTQNITEPGKTDVKKPVGPASKLSDIKKKFEGSQTGSKPEETGIGIILKRRKSIIESEDNQAEEGSPTETKPITVSFEQKPVTSAVKPPPATTKTGSKILSLVIEREGDSSPTPSPVIRPPLKLVMPKPVPTNKALTQPPVSASPPITKQGAVKKIGSLISKVKSNESTSSRERVIPIQFEDDRSSPVSRSGTGGTSGPLSRTGSISISIMSGNDGHSSRQLSLGSPASTLSSPSYSRHNSFGNGIQQSTTTGGGQIMKSKREFIIPITIEERDDATPSADLLTRRNSSTATASSSGASSSSRVYSNRRHTSSNLSLLSPDSTDLEDDFFDDDDFLSSDALFSSLLQRVRGLHLGGDRLFDGDKTLRRNNGRWSNLDFKRN